MNIWELSATDFSFLALKKLESYLKKNLECKRSHILVEGYLVASDISVSKLVGGNDALWKNFIKLIMHRTGVGENSSDAVPSLRIVDRPT